MLLIFFLFPRIDKINKSFFEEVHHVFIEFVPKMSSPSAFDVKHLCTGM